MSLTDTRAFRSFETALWMLDAFRELHPAFKLPLDNDICIARTFDCVLGTPDWRLGHLTTPQLIKRARRECDDFRKSVAEYLLYP